MSQEFISSACIEHLDFLTMRCAEQMSFQPFVERSQITHTFRSLTNIVLPTVNETETENWIDAKVVQLSNTLDSSVTLHVISPLLCTGTADMTRALYCHT